MTTPSLPWAWLVSEQELLTRLRAGDTAAFEQCYEQHYDRLWRFAYSFVRTRAVAQEIVHDVFLAMWVGRESLHVHTSLDGYLYGAVRNRALKSVRHEQVVERESERIRMEADALGMAPHSATALEHLEHAETMDAVRRAIEELPERQRTAILLRWKHGMRYDEIARVLGVSSQAARTFVLRVQETLKTIISRTI